MDGGASSLRARLDALPGRLTSLASPVPRMSGLAPAAVLAPMWVDEGGALRLLLTERSATLRNHAGQISFPGGKPDEEDLDLAATAMREAEEEVALPAQHVRLLGRLAPVPTPTGYLIHPFVARVEAEAGFVPRIESPHEVARILTPSVAELLRPGVYFDQGEREWRGHHYRMHAFAISDPPLWGATARMVYNLLTCLGMEPEA